MKKTFLILQTLLISLFISSMMISCATIKEIPEDKTPAQIIQMGQNAVSAGNYKDAEFCFNTAIERFNTDAKVYAEAKYELAHAYSKQKKYDKAYEIYTQLLEVYESNPGVFAPAYKKLCLIGIENIPETKRAELEKN